MFPRRIAEFPQRLAATDVMSSNHVTKHCADATLCSGIVYDSPTTESEINLAPFLFPL